MQSIDQENNLLLFLSLFSIMLTLHIGCDDSTFLHSKHIWYINLSRTFKIDKETVSARYVVCCVVWHVLELMNISIPLELSRGDTGLPLTMEFKRVKACVKFRMLLIAILKKCLLILLWNMCRARANFLSKRVFKKIWKDWNLEVQCDTHINILAFKLGYFSSSHLAPVSFWARSF